MIKRSLILAITIASILGIVSQAYAAEPWRNANYPKRVEITIQDANIDSDLSAFPVLVELTATGGPGGSGIDDGDLISKRYQLYETGNATPLKYEEEYYAEGQGGSSDKATFDTWIKVSDLIASPTGDQDKIWLYYGNYDPGSDQDDAENVWSNSYTTVYHMPDGTTLSAVDSTSNDNDGIISGAAAASGQIDGAASFNGSSSKITLPAINLGDNFTISFIVYPDGKFNMNTVMANAASGATSNGFKIFFNTWNTTDYMLVLETGNGSSAGWTRTDAGAITPNAYNFLSFVVDRAGGVGAVYLNGVDATGDPTVITNFNNTNAIRLGQMTDTSFLLDGLLDEVHISNTNRLASWIKFEYNNMNAADNELTWGSQEVRSGITISGTVYTAEDKSTNVGADVTIGLSIQGAAKTTDATDADGAFSFTSISINANDTIILFVDDDASYEGNLVSQAADGTTNITGLSMYTNKIVLRHETAGPMTNTLLAIADGSGDDDIHYTIAGSNADFDDGFELWLDD